MPQIKETTKRRKTGGRQKREIVRVQLCLPKATADLIDQVADYLGMDSKPEAIRYLMNKGMEQFRMGQTLKDQADMFGKFVSAVSEEMEHAAETAPRRGGSSSTATREQKCYNLPDDEDDKNPTLPFPK